MQRFFDICGQLFSTLVASLRPNFLEYIDILLIHLVDFVWVLRLH